MQSADVVNVIRAHNASIYHAHQLLDARHYFQQGGILSRSLLTAQAGFTAFFTDQVDQQYGVFNATFFNLFDMAIGAINGNGIGNSYGPILFVFNPEALLEAQETTVSTVTISQLNGRPIQEEITQAYLHGCYKAPGRPQVVFDDRQYTELIFRVERVSFDELAEIIVDPIRYNNAFLPDIVRIEAEQVGLAPEIVHERQFNYDGENVFPELMTWIADSRGEMTEPENRSQWLQRINRRRNRLLTYAQPLWTSTFQEM